MLHRANLGRPSQTLGMPITRTILFSQVGITLYFSSQHFNDHNNLLTRTITTQHILLRISFTTQTKISNALIKSLEKFTNERKVHKPFTGHSMAKALPLVLLGPAS